LQWKQRRDDPILTLVGHRDLAAVAMRPTTLPLLKLSHIKKNSLFFTKRMMHHEFNDHRLSNDITAEP
jgi:hypothetical protein